MSRMHLWLIRHGECELSASRDEERNLTPAGRGDVERVAGVVFAKYPEPPQALLASPLRRARQTAEIFNAEWGLTIHSEDFLQPLVEPSRVLEALRRRPERDLALVGHLPNLGLLLAVLLWGLPAREAAFPRGAAARLELSAWEPGKAVLVDFIKPEEIS